MKTNASPLYHRHRFPPEVIAQAVWLYFRFPLSLRMVEDFLAERGITVSHRTARTWAEKFGHHFAANIRRRSTGQFADKWHLNEVVITGKLRSYGAAKREIMPGVEHRSHKGLNNRSENSHQPTRQRERGMKKFTSPRHLQRFLSIHDPIANLFFLPRHEMTSTDFREMRTDVARNRSS
ncbi:MAG: IS6 family transposase [Litorimonas sp.]